MHAFVTLGFGALAGYAVEHRARLPVAFVWPKLEVKP